MRRFILFVICALIGFGCTSDLEPENRAILLSASVAYDAIDVNSTVKSVSVDPYSGSPSVNNGLPVDLWFSYTSGHYSHYPAAPQYIPCVTSAIYTGSNRMDIKIGENILLYPISIDANYNEVGSNVYCVGFSPQGNWNAPTGSDAVTGASHTIDGSQDLMYAEQIRGSYSSNFPTQHYQHLLTWVKINISATSIEAAGIWGDVESLSIVSPNSTVEISFPESEGASSNFGYSGDPIEFDLTLPQEKSLNITSRTFGQVFCAPPVKNSNNEYGYMIAVKTKNASEKTVFVPLKDESNRALSDADAARGKLFVINLYLNEVKVVDGICTLRHWDDQMSYIYFYDNKNE